MSTLKPIPHDAVLADAEVRRRAELAASVPYQTGIAQAKKQALDNVRAEVETRKVDLKRTAIKRDINAASRASYERCHSLLKAAAARLAAMTGEPVAIPAWLPPPDREDELTELVQVPTVAPTPIVKPTGRGSGVLPGFPGSDADIAYRSLQGEVIAK